MDTSQGLMMEDTSLFCKLKISLFGSKQTSRQWYDKLAQTLCSRSYFHSDRDYSLFYIRIGTSLVFIVVYIYDVI